MKMAMVILSYLSFLWPRYSLIAYSRALADEDRTDRVIATAWDASFCLFDGVPTSDDIIIYLMRLHIKKQGAIMNV